MKLWSDDPQIWQMACEMCAGSSDTFCWDVDSQGELQLWVVTQGVFIGGLDAEELPPEDVLSLYEKWKSEGDRAFIRWASEKNGLKPFAWKNECGKNYLP